MLAVNTYHSPLISPFDCMALTISTTDIDAGALRQWLDNAPPVMVAEDLPALRAQIARHERLSAGHPRYLELLQRLDERLLDLLQTVRPTLRRAGLPLSRELRTLAADLGDASSQIIAGYRRLLERADSANDASDVDATLHGLRAVFARYEIALLTGADAPPAMWLSAHQLYRHAARMNETETGSSRAREAVRTYAHILALGAAAPERFSAVELGSAVDWISRTSVPFTLLGKRSPVEDESWFWVDLEQDAPPVQIARLAAPERPSVRVFSLGTLAAEAASQSVRLVPAAPPARDQEIAPSPDMQLAALLRRLADRWSSPHKRQLHRRRSEYQVSLLVGLNAICTALDNGAQDPTTTPSESGEWRVLNESASGFGVIHVGGKIGDVAAGSVVALRGPSEEAWSICLIRWARSNNPEHVEMGLELISPSAQVVSVAFRGNGPKVLRSALLLPAVPALRPNFAVLAPAGTYTSRRFVLVASTERVYVTQGRMLSLDLQTAAIELLQFEIDPYPI